MDNLVKVAEQVAILFVLMGFGAVLRKTKLVSGPSVDGIVNILILVVTPCLIVDVFQRPFAASMLTGLGVAFAVAVLAHVLVIVVACLLVRPRDDDVRRPLRLAAVFSNAGFMGLPLEQALLGDEGVFYGIVYVVVFNLFMWSWGIRTICGAARRSVKMWVNPGTVGIALGLPLFFLSVRLPTVIGEPIHQMSVLNTPLAMVVIGHYLAGAHLGRVVRMGCVHVAAFVRLVGYPLLVVALLYPFRHQLDRNMMLATVIAASAPVAAMVAMFAAKFDRDVDVAVGVTSGTTLLSVLTMPVVVAFAMSVL